MARPITEGPIEIAIREPLRSILIDASENLGGVAVTRLAVTILEDVSDRDGLENRYTDALKRQAKARRKTA